jgi:hypothetical protein
MIKIGVRKLTREQRMRGQTGLAGAVVAALVAVSCGWASAEELKPVPADELLLLKIENLTLKAQLYRQQQMALQNAIERLELDRQALARDGAAKAGIDWNQYDLDVAGKQFVPRRAEKPKEK